MIMIRSDLKIVCPSRSRANNLLTKKLFIGFNLIVVVPASQLDEYKKQNTEECLQFVGHPNYIKGIAGVRWWIMKKYGNVFMIDDDIDHIRNYSVANTFESIRNPSRVNDIIHNCYLTAVKLGAKMYGFNQLKLSEYKSQVPFELKGYLPSKSFGFTVDHNLKLNQKHSWLSGVEDYYFTLMNANVNRFAFIDNRYCFYAAKGNMGGINDYRKSSDCDIQTTGLLSMFGKAIYPNKRPKEGLFKLKL